MTNAHVLTHWDFVWMSYGLTAIVIVSLVAWILLTGHSRRTTLARLTGGQDGPAND